MKISALYLLLAFILSVGCSRSPKSERVDSSGYFSLTNSTGTVFWGDLRDSATNSIQFVLLLPETDEIQCGGQTRSDVTYDYCVLKTKRGGRLWKIEANGSMKCGIESLRLSDLTVNTVTDIDLHIGRMWQISGDLILVPLDKIDPAISQKVLHDSETGFKPIESR